MESIDKIPDNEILYRNIHKNEYIVNPESDAYEIPNSAFRLRKNEDGISVNWKRFCPTPTDSIMLSQHPENYCAVIQISSSDIRECPYHNMDVIHDPIPKNKAHSLIKGFPRTPRKLKLNVRTYLKSRARYACNNFIKDIPC